MNLDGSQVEWAGSNQRSEHAYSTSVREVRTPDAAANPLAHCPGDGAKTLDTNGRFPFVSKFGPLARREIVNQGKSFHRLRSQWTEDPMKWSSCERPDPQGLMFSHR
jgi:hypothetical protein